jgi:tRNA uridine 5-carboxymethylaminomethyl modification enzyme
MMERHYDVLVIGGGHAGAEAAWAAARLGARTALITFQRAAIGRMSCNPAIGGIGKGQIVREIDALGGLMGLVADETGIQFRMLNRRKGPAVWAPRCQSDMALYASTLRRYLESCPNLTIIEAGVESIAAKRLPAGRHLSPDARGSAGTEVLRDEGTKGRTPRRLRPSNPGILESLNPPVQMVTGVTLHDGRALVATTVVVTAGTFLNGLMHTGEVQTPGGRIGEAAATGLSASLRNLGLALGRLKTGTPPRIHGDTVDFSRVAEQPGDSDPVPFSFMHDRVSQPQVSCWITHTNREVHELIRANLHRAPLFSGQIRSTGPRYCPSIEDKVVRFADKDLHQVFLEPEGRASQRIYANGISTSLPQDVQRAIVRKIPGLENAQILQWGYAVEYDFVPPEQIDATLMTKRVRGLFLAGQINGTSGYEEAAGQGLLAGVNAARYVAGAPLITLTRDQAYIGVMIDDLVTRGVTEPYRMFTSRAEHRMHLRYDNADARLTPLGRQIGLVTDDRWARFGRKSQRLDRLRALLDELRYEHKSLREWLKRPGEDGQRFSQMSSELAGLYRDKDVWAAALVEVKYAGYIERQQRALEQFQRLERQRVPSDINFFEIKHLRREAVERWTAVRPHNVGQAARVSGIHPTDVSLLLVELARRERHEQRLPEGHVR